MLPGMCWMSATRSPWSKATLDVMRTDLRPWSLGDSVEVWSTPMYTLPLEVTLIRPRLWAVAWSTYCTYLLVVSHNAAAAAAMVFGALTHE